MLKNSVTFKKYFYKTNTFELILAHRKSTFWHLGCQSYGNQPIDFSFKRLGFDFDMVKRGRQRVKKTFYKVQESATENSYLSNHQKIFSKCFVEIALQSATLLKRNIVMYFFMDLTPNSWKPLSYWTPWVAVSVGNYKIQKSRLSGVLQKWLYKKLLCIISIPCFHPAILLKDQRMYSPTFCKDLLMANFFGRARSLPPVATSEI